MDGSFRSGAYAGVFCHQSKFALSADYGYDGAALCLRNDLDTVCLVEWRAGLDADTKQNSLRLWVIAVLLVAAVFTRYDGWIMAFLAWVAIGITLARRRQLNSRAFWIASVLVAAAPAFWFVYNHAAFGDWLFFARGPYSAKAIEIRTSAPGFPPHPGCITHGSRSFSM